MVEPLALFDHPLQFVGRALCDDAPAVDDGDAVTQRVRLVHVVCRQQDRGVVRVAQFADEDLHVLLRARIEAGRRLVQQQQDRRGQERARDGDFLLHAARHVLQRLAMRSALMPSRARIALIVGAPRRRGMP